MSEPYTDEELAHKCILDLPPRGDVRDLDPARLLATIRKLQTHRDLLLRGLIDEIAASHEAKP